jgi:hypothetical protein
VEERTGDATAPSACRSQRLAFAVGEFKQGLVASRLGQRRIMEFMAAQLGARTAQRTIGEQPRLTVAEMELAVREAGGMAEQAGHAVADTVGIFERLAERHVAAALAMHPPRRGEPRQP